MLLPAACKRNTISWTEWATRAWSRRDNRYRFRPPRSWWRTATRGCFRAAAGGGCRRSHPPLTTPSPSSSSHSVWSRTCRWCWLPTRHVPTRWGWPRTRRSCSWCWKHTRKKVWSTGTSGLYPETMYCTRLLPPPPAPVFRARGGERRLQWRAMVLQEIYVRPNADRRRPPWNGPRPRESLRETFERSLPPVHAKRSLLKRFLQRNYARPRNLPQNVFTSSAFPRHPHPFFDFGSSHTPIGYEPSTRGIVYSVHFSNANHVCWDKARRRSTKNKTRRRRQPSDAKKCFNSRIQLITDCLWKKKDFEFIIQNSDSSRGTLMHILFTLITRKIWI